MQGKRFVTVLLAAAVTATFGAAAPSTAAAESGNRVTTQDITTALGGVSNLLAQPVPAVADADSAAETGAVDVRHDGTVVFKTPGATDIVITLPYANQAIAVEVANGGVAFGGRGGSGNFVLPTAGGAQMLMVAANAAAPTEYPFQVNGGSVAPLPGGALLLRDAAGQPNRVIPVPWARDATGKAIPTRYTTSPDGTAFSQEVDHRVSGVQYPVVADPSIGEILWAVVRCGAGGWLGWVAAALTPGGIWIRAMTVAASCVTAL